jgi:hypothetical protein
MILPSARAHSTAEVLDEATLANLEARAEHAQPNEQAFLFTELIHEYVEVAGKQVAAGEMDEATATLQRVQTYADRIHNGLGKSTKRVKNAEKLMHLATYRLTELLHVISTEDIALIQATLKQLDRLHDELLQQVFSH